MIMSQMNSPIDKDQSKLCQQLQCVCVCYFDLSNVQQSHPKLAQDVSKRTGEQLSESERKILKEVDKCLKNWYDPWRRTYLEDGPEFSAIYDLMEDLLHYQDQILCNETMLTADRTNAIAHAVARLIDYGNAILNIDITLRATDGTLHELDSSKMTTVELYQAHIEAHRLRDKLLQNYFKTATCKRHPIDSDSPSGNLQHQFPAPGLRVPSRSLSNLPSPVLDRSQRFSTGSNASINTLVSNGSTSDGRRVPQALNSSLIEVRTMSSTEDLSESQLEMRHLIATLKSNAFLDPAPSSIRITLLQGALVKAESLLGLPTTAEKMTNCFELLDTLLISIEKIPSDSRRNEIHLIANTLLETLVRRVCVDDRDNYVEFQRSHWPTYLISLIRMMSASDFSLFLKKFSNSPDLSAFLRDYLFIIKRIIMRPNEIDPLAEPMDPIYPECWIEMSLLVCSTLLESLINLLQILRSTYPSNVPMWLSYIDCLIHFILQDILKPDRRMAKERQVLLADDLRKTSADYVWITWYSLNVNQKYDILEDIIEPLLKVCIKLSSHQRSILLPIFYDMMHCDYTSQYISPRGTICGNDSICSKTAIDRIGSRANYIYEAELEQRVEATRLSVSGSTDSGDSNQLITSKHLPMPRINSDESLPYLSFRDHQQHNQINFFTSESDDGTVLTKFTHLIIGKLYNLIVEMNLGDDEFERELCAVISGDVNTIKCQTKADQANFSHVTMLEASEFKCMAKHTANLISEFIQICLDSRQANKLAYNHLHLLCLFKLILFFRDKVDRIELYLANLHKLWRLHHNAGRFVEAGFTLLEHAKSLTWSNKPLESHYRIITRSFQPAQPLTDYMNLKLFLYTTIIEYFDQGQLWEAAVPLCRELVDIYQFKLFDYTKLAQILDKLSTFFSNISNGNLRSHPEYFRVTFYGPGFPDCLRNSTMIYRGKPCEMLSDFQATLLSKYPDAKLVRTLEQPDESLLAEPEAKYLQINACTPIVDLKSKFQATFSSDIDVAELHESILAYYKHNECDKFEFSRRMNAQLQIGGDDFANMWRQRITLTTNSLPGMLPFFSVFLQETNIISPIECAIEDLERANDRLSAMVNRFKADKRHEEDVRALGQLLLGIVDAAVNGGITKYEQAFFDDDDAASRNDGAAASIPAGTFSTSQAQVPLSGATSANPHGLRADERDACVMHDSVGQLLKSQQHVFGADKCHETKRGHRMLVNSSLHISNCGARASPTSDQKERLKRLIAGQVPLLDEAIRLHSERVAEIMRPQHEHLEASYKRLKHHIMSKYPRYLPAHYHRNSSFSCSSTLRTYRSLARSPNRSIRSETRLSAALSGSLATNGNRHATKRLSDVSRGETPVIVKVSDQSGDASCSDQTYGTVTTDTNIPYKQFNNERRSLPFLTGFSSTSHETGSSSPPSAPPITSPHLPLRSSSRAPT